MIKQSYFLGETNYNIYLVLSVIYFSDHLLVYL